MIDKTTEVLKLPSRETSAIRITYAKAVLARPKPTRKQTKVISARPTIPNRNWTAMAGNRGLRLGATSMPSTLHHSCFRLVVISSSGATLLGTDASIAQNQQQRSGCYCAGWNDPAVEFVIASSCIHSLESPLSYLALS